jgi:hypothetical protein
MKEKNLSYLMSGKVLILGLLDFWSLTSAYGLWEETSNPKGPVSHLEPSPIANIIISVVSVCPAVLLSIHPSHHPSSKFLIPEEEYDGSGGRRRQMAAAAVYPNILTMRNFLKTLKNRNKMKTHKINIFKHETRKGNTVK